MLDNPEIVQTEVQLTAIIRLTIPREETVYHGPYEGLGPAWAEFDAWIAAERHAPASDLWECYVAGPESNPDPATWRTELNRPLTH